MFFWKAFDNKGKVFEECCMHVEDIYILLCLFYAGAFKLSSQIKLSWSLKFKGFLVIALRVAVKIMSIEHLNFSAVIEIFTDCNK